jgi:cellulose synthase/poly-beta-1,6-N-acetylglucosamine synthase-like glycosyltransferase
MLILPFLLKVSILFIISIYILALLFILLYSLSQANLVYNYLMHKRKSSTNKQSQVSDYKSLPYITVQLPVYNERYVVERLIDSVAVLNYPKDKLEIQVLDDSNDESIELIAQRITYWQGQGVDIVQLRREKRTGFKAGALAYGLSLAKGEFIAIFDADFVPNPDFLLQTVPHFEDEAIGMVQTRWEHLNRDYSILTQVQAFGLDAHFTIEQVGRNHGNHFINFNGTAGLWRKSCIIDAGNWQADTLTEDLDLSYRAQLKHWKFKYLENVASPAEIPPIMSAFKSQQYRWTKGGAEVARKQLKQVLQSDKPFSTKWHSLFHLLNSLVFVSIISSALLSVPMLFIKHSFPEYKILFVWASIFVLSFLIILVMYWISSGIHQKGKSSFKHYVQTFPMFLSIMMGLSLHNAIAAIEGYLGRKSPFIRTPKFNLKKTHNWTDNAYLSSKLSALTLIEAMLSLYFLFGIYKALEWKDYGLLPFHIMLCLGFGMVSYYSLFHSKKLSKS